MDISDHRLLVSVYTGLIDAGRRFAGIMYHGQSISVYYIPEQNFITKRNAAEKDAPVRRAVLFGVSAIRFMHTSHSSWLFIPGKKRLFSAI